MSKPIASNVDERVRCALRQLGFSKREATKAIATVRETETETEMAYDSGFLLRAALQALTVSSMRV